VYKLNRPLWMYGSGAHDNVITGNFIGTNATGTYGAAGLALVAMAFTSSKEPASTASAERRLPSATSSQGMVGTE
jgi:hypothetical protein